MWLSDPRTRLSLLQRERLWWMRVSASAQHYFVASCASGSSLLISFIVVQYFPHVLHQIAHEVPECRTARVYAVTDCMYTE